MSSSIFHDYDIRGRYPGEVNEAVFYNLGRAIAHVLKSKKIAVARDARLASETLFLYLVSGLKSQRVKAIDLGLASTPFCLWYSQYFRTDAVMITASHNPKDQNGLKIFSVKEGIVDRNSGLLKIKKNFEKMDFPALEKDWLRQMQFIFFKSGVKKHQPLKDYLDFILKKVGGIAPGKIKLVLDCSHGSAGREFVCALEKIKANFVTLNEKPNGNFPHHGPNPLDEASQRSVRALVKSKKFGLGAVIDGDGDRILFLDEKGEAVEAAHLFSFLIDFYAKARPLKAVVKNAALAKIVDETARELGIKAVTAKVGRTNVQRAMKKEKAGLGGEKSGHYFFKDFYYGDNALVALLWVLKILAKEKEPFSKLLSSYRKYVVLPEINLPFEGKIDRIIGDLKRKYAEGKTSQLDGLTVEYPAPVKSPKGDHGASWRFNLRRSNTEAVWRLNLEGSDRKELEQLREEIEEILQ